MASAAGDRDAFAELYRASAARAFGLALRILADRQEAEHVVRDAFLEAWHRAGEYESSGVSGRAWILGLVHRVASASRRERGDAGIPAESEPIVAGRRMARAFAALSQEQRAAVFHAYYGGRSEPEIAELLRAPIDTVRARLRDGLSRVRSELGILS